MQAQAEKHKHEVIIVGGGPVGMFLGLSLARKNVEVLVLEAEREIGQSPRALMHFPLMLNEFAKLGVLDDIVRAGYKNQEGLTFRTPAGGSDQVLARIPPGKASKGSIDYGVQVGQPKLVEILRRHAKQLPKFQIRYDARFVGLHEDNDFVHVEVCNQAGTESTFFSAQHVVACDGASSPVRKALDIPFEGFTWDDWRFLAINLRYDFDRYGYPAANHVIDAEDWAVVVRASNQEEGLWRIATGISPEIPVEEIEKHLPAKLERLLPGPRPLKYEIVAVNPYWAHERVASTYRSGRVVLCGDSAHVNNPLTALGLSTGLVDAAVLARLLSQVFTPEGSHLWSRKLDLYASMRRQDFVTRVQKQAIEGKRRIHSTDKKVVAQREDFFNMLNKNEGFGMFIASTMMETLPDNLEPSRSAVLLGFLASALTTIGIVARILWWKLRASIL